MQDVLGAPTRRELLFVVLAAGIVAVALVGMNAFT